MQREMTALEKIKDAITNRDREDTSFEKAFSTLLKTSQLSQEEKNEALFFALTNTSDIATLLLIANGADKKARDKDGNTPFMVAAIHSNPRLLPYVAVLEEVGTKNKNGQTALHLVAEQGGPFAKETIETLFTLYSTAFDPRKKDNSGNTALMSAMLGKNATNGYILLPLLSHEDVLESINTRNNEGKTVLDQLEEIKGMHDKNQIYNIREWLIESGAKSALALTPLAQKKEREITRESEEREHRFIEELKHGTQERHIQNKEEIGKTFVRSNEAQIPTTIKQRFLTSLKEAIENKNLVKPSDGFRLWHKADKNLIILKKELSKTPNSESEINMRFKRVKNLINQFATEVSLPPRKDPIAELWQAQKKAIDALEKPNLIASHRTTKK